MQAGLEVQNPTMMEPKDNGLAPLVAIEGIHFIVPSICEDCGDRILSFDNQNDLDATKSYYDKLGESSAAFFSWTFTKDNILVQINGELPQEKANQYRDTLSNLR